MLFTHEDADCFADIQGKTADQGLIVVLFKNRSENMCSPYHSETQSPPPPKICSVLGATVKDWGTYAQSNW